MTQAIFLSYASQDADAARRLCDALRAAGLEVWFDQSELRGNAVHTAAAPSETRLTKSRRFILSLLLGGLSIGAVHHQRRPSADSTAVLLQCVALDC